METTLIVVASFVLIYIAGELIGHYLVFGFWLNRKFDIPRSSESAAQLKRHIERFMLFLSFAAGLPQVVIAFGGIKIGAWFIPREKKEKADKPKMDFFLIGNLISITLTVSFYITWGPVCALLLERIGK